MKLHQIFDIPIFLSKKFGLPIENEKLRNIQIFSVFNILLI